MDFLGADIFAWTPRLLMGAGVTLALSIGAFAVGLVIGLSCGLVSISRLRALAWAVRIYVTVFRGVPELLVVFLFFFGTATAVNAVASVWGYRGFVDIPAFIIGIIAMSTVVGAYSTEVFRTSLLSIPIGQLNAADSFGLSAWQRLRLVVLPQTLKASLPDLGNLWLGTLKDTAIVSVTGVAELAREAAIASGSTQQPFPIYGIAAVLYLLMTAISYRAVRRLDMSVQWS